MWFVNYIICFSDVKYNTYFSFVTKISQRFVSTTKKLNLQSQTRQSSGSSSPVQTCFYFTGFRLVSRPMSSTAAECRFYTFTKKYNSGNQIAIKETEYIAFLRPSGSVGPFEHEDLNVSVYLCCFRTVGCRSGTSWCPSTKSPWSEWRMRRPGASWHAPNSGPTRLTYSRFKRNKNRVWL